MRTLNLISNEQADWSGKEYFFDENGQAHAQHLHWGDDYTLEDGSAIDDVDAIVNGFVLGNIDDSYDEEWN